MKLLTAAVIVLCSSLFAVGSYAKTGLVVQYPYGSSFDPLMHQLKNDFEQQNPDITIHYRPSYTTYEDCIQRLMREAIT